MVVVLGHKAPSREAARTLEEGARVGGRSVVVVVGPEDSEGGAWAGMGCAGVRAGEEAVLARSDRQQCSGCKVV